MLQNFESHRERGEFHVWLVSLPLFVDLIVNQQPVEKSGRFQNNKTFERANRTHTRCPEYKDGFAAQTLKILYTHQSIDRSYLECIPLRPQLAVPLLCVQFTYVYIYILYAQVCSKGAKMYTSYNIHVHDRLGPYDLSMVGSQWIGSYQLIAKACRTYVWYRMCNLKKLNLLIQINQRYM